jgi:hypothetical protein
LAAKYQNADATIVLPKRPNPDNHTGFVLFFSIVTNLQAYDFTRPFYGKTMSEVESFFKASNFGASAGYTLEPDKYTIRLSTEGVDMEFHSNKDVINRIDFYCDSHD